MPVTEGLLLPDTDSAFLEPHVLMPVTEGLLLPDTDSAF
jgi:hypothetical protein